MLSVCVHGDLYVDEYFCLPWKLPKLDRQIVTVAQQAVLTVNGEGTFGTQF